jgi:hypothetical protein
LLGPGGRVWVRVPGSGFVGVCCVTGSVTPAADFMVAAPAGEAPVLEVTGLGSYHGEFADVGPDLDIGETMA